MERGNVLFSYGDDFDIIRENLKLYSLKIPFNKKKFLDIRAYFALNGVPVEEYHSGNLYQYFGLSMENHEHNASFDAWSILLSLRVKKGVFYG